MPLDIEVFGERLKKLRSHRGFTTTQLGKALGVNNATISKWENGTIRPSGDSIYEIATFFNVPADYILGIKDFQFPSNQALE